MRKIEERQRGFTLMEMMVALLLGAVIITPLYIVTRGMSLETTRRQMETEAMQRARLGLELLAADFQRAGMMVSPNPGRDPESIVQPGQHAHYRLAVVHLNRLGTGPDAALIVGNLVTADTYTAVIDNSGALVLNELHDHCDDCRREFNPFYAYAHLTTATGQSLDARIGATTGTTQGGGCRCTVTLETGELILDGPGGFAVGQQVFVQANQAALYRVETVNETGTSGKCNPRHDNLVRYFVDYDGVSQAALGGQSCSLASINEALLDPSSAKVIAEYVTDFQVWFRTVRSGTAATIDLRPNYHGPSTNAGLVPANASPIYGDTADSVATAGHLSCDPVANMGPEHVRSAAIRLAVRTETTDPQLRGAEFTGPGVARFNVAAPPADDSLCVGLYKVRTLTTEVAMPNLAARVASFSEVPTL